MKKILSLDASSGFIAWAILEANNNTYKLSDKGVVVFPALKKNSDGLTPCAERRSGRMMRHNKFHRSLRKFKTLRALIKNGYCPLDLKSLSLWRKNKTDDNKWLSFVNEPDAPAFLDWKLSTNGVGDTNNPYYFRDLISREKLDLKIDANRYMIGRAFYHIAQRRGFVDSRLSPELSTYEMLLDDLRDSMDDDGMDDFKTSINTLLNNYIGTAGDDDDKGLKKKINKLKDYINEVILKNDQPENIILAKINKESGLNDIDKGIKTLTERMKEENCQTLGQLFFKDFVRGNKIRGQYTSRDEHYLAEFNHVCDLQGISGEFRTELEKSIFHKTPPKKGAMPGKCSLEPKEQRAPKYHPRSEEYRMWSFINNIRVKKNGVMVPLDGEQRLAILPLFLRSGKVNFDFKEIREKLNIEKCNYKDDQTVKGCPTIAQLIKVFGKNKADTDWESNMYDACQSKEVYKRKQTGAKKYERTDEFLRLKTPDEVLTDVLHAIAKFDDSEKLTAFAKKHFKLNDKSAAKLAGLKFKEPGYCSLSLKSMNKILPFLKDGMDLRHAGFVANMDKILGLNTADMSLREEDKVIYIRKTIGTLIDEYQIEKKRAYIVNALIDDFRNNYSNADATYVLDEQDKKEVLDKIIDSYGGQDAFNAMDESDRGYIVREIEDLFQQQLRKKNVGGNFLVVTSLKDRVSKFLNDEFGISAGTVLKYMYDTDRIDVYPDAITGEDGKSYLGSPVIAAIKNPAFTKAMYKLRSLVNQLIKDGKIDEETTVHVRATNELLDTNMQKAITLYNKEMEKENSGAEEAIKKYFAERGKECSPTKNDIKRYRFWEEQKHKCMYTGVSIEISDFVGEFPKYDLEHIIPTNACIDNSLENLCLACVDYNRTHKGIRLPVSLENYAEAKKLLVGGSLIECHSILEAAEIFYLKNADKWKKEFDKYKNDKSFESLANRNKRVSKKNFAKLNMDYWRSKYHRFTMKYVSDKFRNNTLTDMRMVAKYAALYLKTIFKVNAIKSEAIELFKDIWQVSDSNADSLYTSHINDAIVSGCITKWQLKRLQESMAKNITFKKPWETFNDDLLDTDFNKDVIVVHQEHEKKMFKQTKKQVWDGKKKKRNKKGEFVLAQGDTLRGCAHRETIFGGIEKDINGTIHHDKSGLVEPNFVVHRDLLKIKATEVEKIVDPVVRKIVTEAVKNKILIIREKGGNALAGTIWYNEERRIPIKGARIYGGMKTAIPNFKKHRKLSLSKTAYKQNIYVQNEKNFALAIYEWLPETGGKKRECVIKNTLDAGLYYRRSNKNKDGRKTELAPLTEIFTVKVSPIKKGQPMQNVDKEFTRKYLLHKGEFLLVAKKGESCTDLRKMKPSDLAQRLYTVTELYAGGVKLQFHNDSRSTGEIEDACKMNDAKNGSQYVGSSIYTYIKINANELEALVDGVDFKISPTGEVDFNFIAKSSVAC